MSVKSKAGKTPKIPRFKSQALFRASPFSPENQLFAKCLYSCTHNANIVLVNVIGKPGLMDLLKGKSKDVQQEALAWYAVAKGADWGSFAAVRETVPDADLVNGLLLFNIRQNRYRLIVYPVFSRRKLYIKALLSHKEYDRKDWEHKWP